MIVDGAQIDAHRVVHADACVIGTGAGGAPVAAELAAGGWTVVMLEAGPWHDPASFAARPREMFAPLFRDAGQTVALGNPAIPMPSGRGVGGTTLINGGTCFRPPVTTLRRWATECGLEDLGAGSLDPYLARVESRLRVRQVTPELAGRNAALVKAGADALGLRGDFIFRNASGCVGSGVCSFGCPRGAKLHVGETYVPDAWQHGAITFTRVRARRLVVRGGRLREVLAKTDGGGTVRIVCRHAIVAAGAVSTPTLLRRSRLGSGGALGKYLAVHPSAVARGVFDELVDPSRGVPQSYYVDEHFDDGRLYETITIPPEVEAMGAPVMGDQLRELLLQSRHLAFLAVMVSDESRGQVREIRDVPVVRYQLGERDVERFHRGFEVLAEVLFAAGAREVLVGIGGVPPLRDGNIAPLRAAKVRARDLYVSAWHPQGTARAGVDPATSVVDADLGVHGVEGVHVADASVMPTSLGVNPQLTIMALATRLAFHLQGRATPVVRAAVPPAPVLGER